MIKTLYAIFDGKVLLPEESVDLKPNMCYLVNIEAEVPAKCISQNHALKKILSRATDLGLSDLSQQHDHYLYGIEKQ
jgi:hypothetical protein